MAFTAGSAKIEVQTTDTGQEGCLFTQNAVLATDFQKTFMHLLHQHVNCTTPVHQEIC
jgi:hypothetical protein